MRVIKNYLYNAGYQLLLMIAPVLTTPYVARMLGAHESGINTYTNGWVTIFYLVGQMGITLYGNREVAYKRNDRYERSKTFWGIEALQLMTISVALVAYLVAVFAFSTTFRLFYLLQTLWILAAALDVSWYFMGLEDFKKTVVRNTIVKIISILLIFVLIKGRADLWKYIVLLGGAQLVGNLTLWPYLKKEVQWIPIKDWQPFKHFYPSLLLFIPTITTQVYLVVNKIMLGKMGTPTALGQYDYSDKIVKLVLSVVTATGTVMLPNIANKFANGDVKGIRKSLYKSFDFVTSLSVPMMFGLMAIAVPFANWFLGHGYQDAGMIIFLEAPVIVLIAWSNVTGTQYLMPVDRVREYTTSVMVGAAVNVVANLFLIYVWNAYGAALATVIAEFSVSAYQLYAIQSTIKRRQLFSGLWKYLLSGLIMFVAVNQLSQRISMNLLTLIIEVGLGILVYGIMIWLLKAPIINQIQELRNK